MISRREMLRRSGAAVAGLAAFPGALNELHARPQETDDLTRHVDPFIGTGAHGHTYPGVQLPFGMVQLSPDNGVNGWDWCSGYNWSSDRIVGFSHTHLSGTGIGDMYDILVMPALTRSPPLGEVSSRFSHDEEQASPGYYSVKLRDSGITAELTATERAGFHRYRFSQPSGNGVPSIIVDLGHSLNWDRPTDTFIKIESPTLISGRRLSTGWAPNQHVYFAVSFSRPYVAHWLESEWSQPGAHRQLAGTHVKGVFQFLSRTGGEGLLVKVGISAVSVEGALANLNREIPGWNFDETRGHAAQAWNRALRRIRLGDVSDEEKTLFYTSLYHSLLAPQLFCDSDGSYRGADGEVHRRFAYQNYSVFSLWDTFRAEHPLLTLVQPERVDDMVQSMMSFYREHGLLPVWSLAGNETNTMIGYHSVPVIVDAWSKALTTVDPGEALEAMTESALQDAHGLRYYRRPEPRPLAEVTAEQTRSNLRRIDSLSQNDFTPARLGSIVNGYQRSLSGATLAYHSPYPQAGTALLLRARGDFQPVEWETSPVPEDTAGSRVSFAWIAAMDAGEPRRQFELLVNGRQWFSFRSPRASDKNFRVSGPNDATLDFRGTHRDQHDDLHGVMFLTFPRGLGAGDQLQLSVRAEDAGSDMWYMTFEHPVTFSVSANNVYGFVEEYGSQRQIIRADVENAGPPGQGSIAVDGVPTQARFEFGSNRFVLPAPVVDRETPISVRATIEGKIVGDLEVNLRPVQPFEFVPADWENESVSKTLEYAYDDWCIARLADALGDMNTAYQFRRRARFYRNLFDPETGFMRGRLSDGSWKEPFSPRFSSHRQDEYTEGNAWQYSWFVPHDVKGLIELMGGRESFIAKLDELFDQSSEIEGSSASPDISGLIGQYAHGNEPSHHIAYLYCYAGAPWKTQERVRQITGSLYGTTPEGLPGNEDCGQMSAWLVFSAMGLYPVNPAEGVYVIGTPHYRQVEIDVGDGRTFTVDAPEASSANKYIQSATLNGRVLDRCYVTHAEIVSGGTLRFVMGAEPNRDWATNELSAPPSMTP
ncbi:MAG TPA: GH92 family glycosyl hydrolase [Gemmatimonadota bacterium]|nr:GH92 family glycosyl hydrolase [Gemmatimonadota bacterium]